MSKKVMKKKNLPAASSAESSDADVIPPSGAEAPASPEDVTEQAPPHDEVDTHDEEEPSPLHVWRAAMAAWEARMTVLAQEFDRVLRSMREAPTGLDPQPQDLVTSAGADGAAGSPEAPGAPLDEEEEPESLASSTPRWLHVERFEVPVGDWTAFTRRFRAAYESLGWTEAQALRALPTAMDDDALATFYGLPRGVRLSLPEIFAAMQKIYEPRSVAKCKFQLRRQAEGESPLTYRSALLTLGQAAYPAMDEATLDSLAQEKLLQMAKELQVVLSLPSDNEDHGSSLQLARNIQVNLDLRDEPSAGPSRPLVVGVGSDGGLPEGELTPLTAAAARPPLSPHRRSDAGGRGGLSRCYECWWRGHFARDCWRRRRVFPHSSGPYNRGFYPAQDYQMHEEEEEWRRSR
ncbi:uncharacterized protein LOC144935371 [Lampetra fluviatilis]